MTHHLHFPTLYPRTAELQQREASRQSLALAAEPRVILDSPKGARAAVNPFSLPKTAGGEAAAPPGSRCLLLGRGQDRRLAGSPQLAGAGTGNQEPEPMQAPGLQERSPGCSGRCGSAGLREPLSGVWGLPSALPGRRHGVVRGFSQLPLRVRHPPHRADPEPQSGAHQPRGAARHPRLRDRVSGRVGPGAGLRSHPPGQRCGEARSPAAAVGGRGLGPAAVRKEGQLLAGTPRGRGAEGREPAASLRARRGGSSGRWGGGKRPPRG